MLAYTTEAGPTIRSIPTTGGTARTLELPVSKGPVDPKLSPLRGSRPLENEIIAVSREGRFVAVSAGTAVDIWDTETGERRHRLAGHEGSDLDAAFSWDGKRVFTTAHNTLVGRERRVRVWDVATGRELLTLSAGVHHETKPGPGRGFMVVNASMWFEDGRLYLDYPDRVFDGRPVK